VHDWEDNTESTQDKYAYPYSCLDRPALTLDREQDVQQTEPVEDPDESHVEVPVAPLLLAVEPVIHRWSL
jgi:hypothetical protein